MDEEQRRRERALALAPDDADALGRAVAARLRAGEDVALDLRWRFAAHPARTLETDVALDVWLREPDGRRRPWGRTGAGPLAVPEHAALWLDPAHDVSFERAVEALRALPARGLILRADGEGRRRAPRRELEALAAAVPDLTHLLLAGWDLSADDALAALAGLVALEELAVVWERDPAAPRLPMTDEGVEDMPDFARSAEFPDLPLKRLAPSPALATLPRLRVLELRDVLLEEADDWASVLPRLGALRRLVMPDGPPFAPGGLDRLLGGLDLEALHLRGSWSELSPAGLAALGRMTRLRHLRSALGLKDADCARLAGLGIESLRVGWCQLSAAGLRALAALPALRRLSLQNPWLDEPAIAALASLRGLEALELEDARRGVDLRPLAELPRLADLRLDLSLNLRGDASPLRGAELPGLRSLELTGQVSDRRLREAIAAVPGVTHLAVSTYDGLSGAPVADLARLDGLRRLELAGQGESRWAKGGLATEPLRALAPLRGRPLDELRVLGIPGLTSGALARALLPARPRLHVNPTRPETPWRDHRS